MKPTPEKLLQVAEAIERAWQETSDHRSAAVIAADVVLSSWACAPEIDYAAAIAEKDKQLDAINSGYTLDAATFLTIRRNLTAREIVDAAIRLHGEARSE